MSKDDIEELDDEIEAPEAEEAPPEQDPELVETARKYGWRDRSEYTNPPEGWMDAERFLANPRTQVKMLRDAAKEREEREKALQDQLARIERTSQTAIERARQQERAAAERRFKELAAQQRQAAAQGDVERFDQLRQQEDDERQALQQSAPEQPNVPLPDWAKDAEMVRIGANMIEAAPWVKALPPDRQIAWAEQQLRTVYPDRFEAPKAEQPKPSRPAMSKVDGGGLAGGSRGNGVHNLPAEAKQVGQQYVKEGVYGSLEEYAKDYWAEEA